MGVTKKKKNTSEELERGCGAKKPAERKGYCGEGSPLLT